VVTICTASKTFNNSTFSPLIVFVCFVWIWEQTAIISLYSINWLVCVTERLCVHCAVQTGYLNVTQIKFRLYIHVAPAWFSCSSPEISFNILAQIRPSKCYQISSPCIPPDNYDLRFYSKEKWTILNCDMYFTYRQFNIQQFSVLPTQCIYVFCVDLRTNSGYFHIQH